MIESWVLRSRDCDAARRSRALPAVVENLESRALLTPLPIVPSTAYASAWTGYWKTNDGVLIVEGLQPSHEGQYPFVNIELIPSWTDPSNPKGWKASAPEIYMYTDANKDNPLSSVLSGSYTPFAEQANAVTFSFKMPAGNADEFSGKFTQFGVTTELTGTYAGIALDNGQPPVLQDPAVPRPTPIDFGPTGTPPIPKQVAPPVLHPTGSVVQDTEPTFTWSPVPGATSYAVSVRDVTPGRLPNLQNVYDPNDVKGTSLTMPFTLDPVHQYQVKVLADYKGGQTGWSNTEEFQVAEQKTTHFRIRLDTSIEIAGVIGGGSFTFTIQAVKDDQNRPALGPPHLLTFGGVGVGLALKGAPPFSLSGKSSWAPLTSATPMYLSSFSGVGSIILDPSISLGFLGGTDTEMTLGFVTFDATHFKQKVRVSSTGLGVTLYQSYTGTWVLLGYDTSLWPNFSS